MVERQESPKQGGQKSWRFWVGAGVLSVTVAAVIFADSTMTVQADSPLARPASTLPPAGPPATLLGATSTSPKARNSQKSGLRGLATWYGRVFDGRLTANGERYDMFAMTAASNALPFGTLVRVVNLRTGKSVDVRVNDRGDLPHNGVIDLSYEAAKRLNILESGVAHVKLEVLSIGSGPRMAQP
jgi:rare lipoprotein A